MIIKEVVSAIESFAPLAFQEKYDNAGLLVGNSHDEVSAVLIAVDITDEVLEEAIAKGVNLIIGHHPLIFEGLKSLTGKTYVERHVIKAVKNNVAIYAAHTNLDNVTGGINSRMADKLELENSQILAPKGDELRKLAVFVPADYANQVREGLFDAGAGHIGNYDACSYNLEGKGSFRGDENTEPFAGKKGELHFENEIRIETIFPKHKTEQVINRLIQVHPYEEVAYDVYPLKNKLNNVGSGMIGNLSEPMEAEDFLDYLKQKLNVKMIKHTAFLGRKIERVAMCGGSGSFLIPQARRNGADVFITADVKYHQFFDADGAMIIMDIGHYESEQFSKEIFYEILTEKFSTFAVHLSEVNTNPVNYY